MPSSEPEELLVVQKAAQLKSPMPDLAARRGDLRRLRAALLQNSSVLIAAIDRDFGQRSVTETVMSDIAPVIGAIDYALRHLPRWMRAVRKAVPMMFLPGRAWVEWRPAGFVGIVGTWNFPLLLTVGPLVDALAAGNRVLLKPSEFAPCFAAALQDVIRNVFPAEQVAVVLGDASVAQRFCGLAFDHLLFTGSARVGRLVACAAAANLTPVTLELGGKCPAFLAADYDMRHAVRAIAAGKFLNAGQVCLAPDYLLVPKGSAVAVGRAVFAQAQRMFPSVAGNRDYTAILGAGRLALLRAMLEEAESAGATVLRGADAVAEGKLAPVVVINPPVDCMLMRDEIFGPILPVLEYDDLDHAIALMRAHPDPLAIYSFTKDRKLVRRLLDAVPAGGIGWNGTILQGAMPSLPFGGVGRSGMGRYHGQAGFERFSRCVSIYRPGFFSGFLAMVPPHGVLARLVRRAVLRG